MKFLIQRVMLIDPRLTPQREITFVKFHYGAAAVVSPQLLCLDIQPCTKNILIIFKTVWCNIKLKKTIFMYAIIHHQFPHSY